MSRLLTRSLPVALALTLLGGGCTYVTDADYREKLRNLDQDGDGAKFFEDCDDLDPLRAPHFDEIPYDGIDNNCEGFDLIDVDGDGYAGVDKDEYIDAFGLDWPSDVHDAFDCDDNDATVFPGAVNTWYDGIDQGCEGINDFDQDGDGYMPDTWGELTHEEAQEAYEAYLERWGYDFGTPLWGDCDDTRADVNPGMEWDEPYDGVDQNCDGLNDFDFDQDGYMPDAPEGVSQAAWEAAYWDYVNHYGYDFGTPQWGDCVDMTDESWPFDIEAHEIHPGATEVWYDGVDQDCDGANDFDFDGDTFMPDQVDDLDREELEARYNLFVDTFGYTYETMYGLDSDPRWGDCDDEDPNVHPLAMEFVGDGVDRNCSGHPDTAAFTFGTLNWEVPRRPRVGATENHFMLVTVADQLVRGMITFTHPAVALTFPRDVIPGENPANVVTWHIISSSADYPLGYGVGMAAPGDDRIYVATTALLSTGATNLTTRNIYYNDVTGGYETDLAGQPYAGAGPAPYFDTDVRIDSTGRMWAVACRDDVMTYVSASDLPGEQLTRISGSTVLSTGGNTFRTCFLDVDVDEAQNAHATACTEEGTCVTYRAARSTNSLVLATDQPYAGHDYISGHTHEPYHVFVLPDGGFRISDGVTQVDVLTEYLVHSADVSLFDGVYYLAAVVDDIDGDDINDIVMAYGPSLADLQVAQFPYRDEAGHALEPEHVSIHADHDRLFLAATGDERVGWVFMGWAEDAD